MFSRPRSSDSAQVTTGADQGPRDKASHTQRSVRFRTKEPVVVVQLSHLGVWQAHRSQIKRRRDSQSVHVQDILLHEGGGGENPAHRVVGKDL